MHRPEPKGSHRGIRMRTVIALLVLAVHCLAAGPPADEGAGGADALVFAYFSDETAGLRLAISLDGLNWDTVNGGEPMLPKPFGPVFRDPALARAPNGEIYMAWTTGWRDSLSMGFARTRDLIHWTSVREIPLMRNTPGALNVWAPELFYDRAGHRWMAHWASSVTGRFPETRPPQPSYNNRMYCAFSGDDMEKLGPEQLLYDEGFIVNDAHLMETGDDPRGKYCLLVKKVASQPRHGATVQIHLTFSDDVAGPYRITGGPITGKYTFCEGPTVARIGGYYYCYFDLSHEHRIGGVRSPELKADPWEDVTDQLTLPPYAKHGSVLPISGELYERLRRYGITR